MSYQIIVGDARTELAKLPSESIDCIITSPPYYSLRDYGTASWIGGDKNCSHKVGRATRGGLTDKQQSSQGSFGDEAIKNGEACPHCGAIRQDAQVGLENTVNEYISTLSSIFSECYRVLKSTGTFWLNLGDSYRNKELLMVPCRVVLRLQQDGWILRNDIIWEKPNVMPSSAKDRLTVSHEHIFLLTKSKNYFFDRDAILEPYTTPMNRWGGEVLKADGKSEWDEGTGQKSYRHRNMRPNSKGRNRRTVWKVPTNQYKGAHFAVYPPKLIEPCVLGGCPKYGTVLDPFAGSGTTAGVAHAFDRNSIMIELNYEYAKLIPSRIKDIMERYGK